VKGGVSRKRRNQGLRGRPSSNWMMVSIQTSVSGSICQLLQIYAYFDCVIINHQKGDIVKKMAPNRPLFVILVIE